MDAELRLRKDLRSVNLTVNPLVSDKGQRLGSMLML
jgi:hypothetical protein